MLALASATLQTLILRTRRCQSPSRRARTKRYPMRQLKGIRVEYAVSGQARCRECQLKVAKATIRVGDDLVNQYGPYTRWYHLACYRFVHGCREDALSGLSYLRDEDKQAVRSAMFARQGSAESPVEEEPLRWTSLPSRTASGQEVDESYREEHDVSYGRARVLIVGCQYYKGTLSARQTAKLVREPANKYDANAIRVDNEHDVQVGHLKRIYAAALAPLADDPSPARPRLELVVEDKPASEYDVVAQVEIHGLPEHFEAVDQHLKQFGMNLQESGGQSSLQRTRRTTVHFNARAKSQQELDTLFESLAKESPQIDMAAITEVVAQCASLKATLLPHQLVGVAWMISRESGFSLDVAARACGGCDSADQPLPPLWERVEEHGQTVYLNSATNTSQSQRPPAVRGGILSDAMGLGKTVQALALCALRKPQDQKCRTLIVCPTAVLQTWVNQAAAHTTLSTLVYHGHGRDVTVARIQAHDLVITTYGVLAAEFSDDSRKRKRSKLGVLGFEFQRAILDEAHFVRNIRTVSFGAVKAIKARHRWCLTGTPLVNKVDDFFALFNFVQAPPVDDIDIFRRCVSYPLGQGDPRGLSCLRVLVKSLALRRGKQVVELPPRTVETRYVDVFQGCAANRRAYDALFWTTGAAIRALKENALAHYSSILEVLTRLRQICSAGASLVPLERIAAAERALAELESRPENPSQLSMSKATAESILSRLKDAIAHARPADQSQEQDQDFFECVVCLNDTPADDAKCLPCQHFYCSACTVGLLNLPTKTCALCRTPFARKDVKSIVSVRKAATAAAHLPEGRKMQPLGGHEVADLDQISPKITAVIDTVRALPRGEKAVVFSQFVGTLEKVKTGLEAVGVSVGLFTGSVSASRRAQLISAFQRQHRPVVLLVSLKCGGQGLNLTRANTVCLLDPWWNCSTEDQALDRVHRIGQTRPVHAIKFLAAKTIEERILDRQKAKSILSQGSHDHLSPEQLRQARIGEIEQLFRPFPDSRR